MAVTMYDDSHQYTEEEVRRIIAGVGTQTCCSKCRSRIEDLRKGSPVVRQAGDGMRVEKFCTRCGSNLPLLERPRP